MVKDSIRAGLAIRRAVRRYLLESGIRFTEEKGWLDSVFYFSASPQQYQIICRDMKQFENSLEGK